MSQIGSEVASVGASVASVGVEISTSVASIGANAISSLKSTSESPPQPPRKMVSKGGVYTNLIEKRGRKGNTGSP